MKYNNNVDTSESKRVIRVMLNGCNGKMGQMFARVAQKHEDIFVAAGRDIDVRLPDDASFDVVVDFSNAAALSEVLKIATDRSVPVVLATTGYTDNQLIEIDEAASVIPVFKAANLSVGINLMAALIKKAAVTLSDSFDIEIIEAHHNQKVDAPSGTAFLLADAMNAELYGKMDYNCDRHSRHEKRAKNEIGIHAIRGGTIVGEHTVIFAGSDEVLEFKHKAASREVFAEGAVRAVRFITERERTPGRYDMNDVLSTRVFKMDYNKS